MYHKNKYLPRSLRATLSKLHFKSSLSFGDEGVIETWVAADTANENNNKLHKIKNKSLTAFMKVLMLSLLYKFFYMYLFVSNNNSCYRNAVKI